MLGNYSDLSALVDELVKEGKAYKVLCGGIIRRAGV